MPIRFSRPTPTIPTFKFRDPNGDLHKQNLPDPPSLAALTALVAPHFPTPFKLKYMDPEGDSILLLSDHELSMCLQESLVPQTSLKLDVIPVTNPITESAIHPSSTHTNSTSSDVSTASTASIPINSNTSAPSSPASISPSSPRFHRRSFKSNLRVYNRALAIDSANIRALRGRANLYLGAQQWEDACVDFKQILDLVNANHRSSSSISKQWQNQIHIDEQEIVQVRRGLVLALLRSGKYKEAVGVEIHEEEEEEEKEWLAKMLKEHLDRLAGKAMGLLESGKYGAAVEIYGDALAVEEVYVEVGQGRRKLSLRVGRAMANEALERVSLALEDYREVVAMGGGMIGWRGCGRCLLEIGELEEAYEMYHKALMKDPTCEEAIERMDVIKKLGAEAGTEWAEKKGSVIEWWQAGNKTKV